MAQFLLAYAETADKEKGYSNRATDPGGETWRGIARKKNPNWNGWALVDQLRKQKAFPDNLLYSIDLQKAVLDFFKNEFWDCMTLDQVNNQKIANKLYDISVNTGQVTAGKMLQRALNALNQNGKYYPDLIVDGKVGTTTVKALNSHPRQEVVFKAINALQGAYYIGLGETNKSLEEYENGWFENRVASVLEDHIAGADVV